MMKTIGLALQRSASPPAARTRPHRRRRRRRRVLIGREDVSPSKCGRTPLSAKEPVRPDGKISLPMIGEIRPRAAPPGAEEARSPTSSKPMVKQPVVRVMVSEINAAKFFVLGEVAHPGAYPVRGTVNVIQALALAGGPTEYANRGGGGDPTGRQRQGARYKVDAKEISPATLRRSSSAG